MKTTVQTEEQLYFVLEHPQIEETNPLDILSEVVLYGPMTYDRCTYLCDELIRERLGFVPSEGSEDWERVRACYSITSVSSIPTKIAAQNIVKVGKICQ